MVRNRPRPRARDRRPHGKIAKPRPTSPLTVVGTTVGVVVGLVVLAFGSRWLATQVAPVLFVAADGDHLRLVAFLLVLWAAAPPLALAATTVRERRGRWAAVPVWVLVAGLVLLLLGFIPGRGNNGRLARELSSAVGGSPLGDTGTIFTGSALAALLCLLVVTSVTASWMRIGTFGQPRPSGLRALTGALAYVGAWVAAGAIVLASVGSGPGPRIDWLEDTADVLRGGDDGITGDFQVGLDASVLDVVDCDTAAERLRVDGQEPDLDGCRRALLVAGTGRLDAGGTRTSSGSLVAVVIQVRTEGQLDDLADSLEGVDIEAGDGLPEPPGDVLVNPAGAALSLVVAAEDTGDIPLPAEGAGRRPITRALAYVVIGTAVGLYVSPPEENPGPGR